MMILTQMVQLHKSIWLHLYKILIRWRCKIGI